MGLLPRAGGRWAGGQVEQVEQVEGVERVEEVEVFAGRSPMPP